MELISYSEFAKLRLRNFVSNDVEIFEREGVEWLGGYWIGESVRGADFARWEEIPNETGGMDLDFSLLPDPTMRAILETIQLPLRPGMKLEEVYSILGQPKERDIFGDSVHDRQTDNFETNSAQPHHIGCSVHNDTGLLGVSVVRGDILSKVQAKEAAFIAELKAEQSRKKSST